MQCREQRDRIRWQLHNRLFSTGGDLSSTHSQPEHKKSRPIRSGFLLSIQTTTALFSLNPMVSQELVLPGIELFSQGATPQISSPLLRFTTEFEMDRSGTTALWTPG